MKRSDAFYWSNEMAAKKDFVWNSDSFNNPIRIRKELATFNKVRQSNVTTTEVIKEIFSSFWKGIFK